MMFPQLIRRSQGLADLLRSEIARGFDPLVDGCGALLEKHDGIDGFEGLHLVETSQNKPGMVIWASGVADGCADLVKSRRRSESILCVKDLDRHRPAIPGSVGIVVAH